MLWTKCRGWNDTLMDDYRRLLPEPFIWDVFWRLARACQSMANTSCGQGHDHCDEWVHMDIKPDNGESCHFPFDVGNITLMSFQSSSRKKVIGKTIATHSTPPPNSATSAPPLASEINMYTIQAHGKVSELPTIDLWYVPSLS